MPLKHKVLTAFLNAGVSLALQPPINSVRELLNRLHPVETKIPLIRLGAHGDGGYLLPDDIEGIVGCFSPGVDNRATFEEAILKRGIPCFLADASVEGAPITSDMVHFTRKYLGVVKSDLTMTFDDWIAEHCSGSADLMLQMDIEGAEWEVLLNVSSEALRRFRIVIIEFHDLERLFDKHAFRVINAAFERLLAEFHVVHVHPNNYGGSVRRGKLMVPRVLEITLLRKDRAIPTGFVKTFPHPLDIINDPRQPDVKLSRDWYGGPPQEAEKQEPEPRQWLGSAKRKPS
jgi:hypothetical protein